MTFAIPRATLASAKLSCPDLSKFDVTCSADEFSGIRVRTGKDAEPKKAEQGESSLTAIFASDNRCSLLMKRNYMDIRQGKEVKYTMSCFFPDLVDHEAHEGENAENKEDQLEGNDNIEDEGRRDGGRLVCTNAGFDLPGDTLNVHMEINGEFVNYAEGELLYLFGTASSAKEISSWTDTCKLM
jgi:hypothetical protein